jgi:DNA-binding MarR family transcriptional regulator
MMKTRINDDILEKVSMDLLSIPPLIFRAIRTKITKTTLSETDIDITPLHFEIIRLLEEKGTLHASEIGEKLQIAKAQMTKLIDRLAELNMVERKMDTADRRTYNITLTDGAREILEAHKRRVINAVREIMSNLSDEELDNLSISLRNLRDVLLRNTSESVSK